MRRQSSILIRHLARPVSILVLSALLTALLAGELPVKTAARPVGGLYGPQPFVTVLCRFPGALDEPEPPAFFKQLMQGPGYPALDDYWRRVSYGAINLEGSIVIGWYGLPLTREAYQLDRPKGQVSSASSSYDLARLARDCVASAQAAASTGVAWQRYYGINLVFNQNLDQSWGGRICLAIDGDSQCFGTTWIGLPDIARRQVWAHELGHAFGLLHSSGDNGQPYDDVWDIMSDAGACWPDVRYGDIAQEPLAYDKDTLGWIPAERKYLAQPEEVTTVTLERLANPGAEGYLLAEIPIDGSADHFYTIEARRRAGYDTHLPDDAVVIHEIDTRRDRPARAVSRLSDNAEAPDTGSALMWSPGDIFRDTQHHIAVSVDRATSTGYAITIDTMATSWPTLTENGATPQTALQVPSEPQGEARQADGLPIPVGTKVAIARDSRGNAYALWIESTDGSYLETGTSEVRAAYRAAGQGWSQSVLVSDAAAYLGDASPGIALDEQGNAYAVWKDGRDVRPGIYAAYKPAGGAWGKNQRVDDGREGTWPAYPVLAINRRGDAYATWHEYRNRQTFISGAYRPAGGPWQPEEQVSAEPGSSQGPAAALDEAGNAYLLWQRFANCEGVAARVGDLTLAVRPASAAASGEPDASGRPPVQVERAVFDDLRRPALAVDEHGGVFAVWWESGEGTPRTYSISAPLP